MKPLIWETLAPPAANLYYNYFTLPFSFYIFCWRPFHPFYYPKAWSMSTPSPTSLAISRWALLSSLFAACNFCLKSITFFYCSWHPGHFPSALLTVVFSRECLPSSWRLASSLALMVALSCCSRFLRLDEKGCTWCVSVRGRD